MAKAGRTEGECRARTAKDAVLFDLGNTLVSYYESADFIPVLDYCIQAICHVLHANGVAVGHSALFEKAKLLNRERKDLRVWPLHERLKQIVEDTATACDDLLMREMVEAFLAPIFKLGCIDPQALGILIRLRELGYKTAIISNTPWCQCRFRLSAFCRIKMSPNCRYLMSWVGQSV